METLDKIKKNVDHPSHYGGADNPYEAIKVLREWQLTRWILRAEMPLLR